MATETYVINGIMIKELISSMIHNTCIVDGNQQLVGRGRLNILYDEASMTSCRQVHLANILDF